MNSVLAAELSWELVNTSKGCSGEIITELTGQKREEMLF